MRISDFREKSMTDGKKYSLYITWNLRASGELHLTASVVPDGDPPPGDLSGPDDEPEQGVPHVTRVMAGIPSTMCDLVARSYVAIMRAEYERVPLAPMSAETAGEILAAAPITSRKALRHRVRMLGYDDIYVAIGLALKTIGGLRR